MLSIDWSTARSVAAGIILAGLALAVLTAVMRRV